MLDAVTAPTGKMTRTAVFARGTPDTLGCLLDFSLGVFGKGVFFRVFRFSKILIIFKEFLPIDLFLTMTSQAVDLCFFALAIPSDVTFVAVMIMRPIG